MKVEVLDGTQHFASTDNVPTATQILKNDPDAYWGQGKHGPVFDLPDEEGYDLLRSVSATTREEFDEKKHK